MFLRIAKYSIVSLTLFLIILEITFRVLGFIRIHFLIPEYKKTPNVFTVLCVGDSTTEGLGVNRKFSYPTQLQHLLDKQAPKKFHVINIGISGFNSSQVLNRFEGNLKKYHPDLVVLLIGINDPWNMNETNIEMFDHNIPLQEKIDISLNKLRIYHFYKLILMSLSKPTWILSEKDKNIASGYQISPERRQALYELLSYNIKKIVRLAQENKALIFLQTYQKRGFGDPRTLINKIYEEIPVPIVDNETLFNEAEKRHLRWIGSDTFHPNKEGYAAIAKNVYETMVKQGLVTGISR